MVNPLNKSYILMCSFCNKPVLKESNFWFSKDGRIFPKVGVPVTKKERWGSRVKIMKLTFCI